jgi:hypothetical protein
MNSASGGERKIRQNFGSISQCQGKRRGGGGRPGGGGLVVTINQCKRTGMSLPFLNWRTDGKFPSHADLEN